MTAVAQILPPTADITATPKRIHGASFNRAVIDTIDELIDLGYHPSEIPTRIGYSIAAIEKRCARGGRHDLEALFARERRAQRRAA